MLAKPSKKLIPVICSLLILAYFYTVYQDAKIDERRLDRELKDNEAVASEDGLPDLRDLPDYEKLLTLPTDDDANDHEAVADADEEDPVHALLYSPDTPDYREIFSMTTSDRKFIPIFLGGKMQAYNPNIIPHPTKYDMWIIVGQLEQSRDQIEVSGQITCNAGFLNGVLVCAEPPTVLPVTPSIRGKCEGDLAYFNFRFGPRDARMFHGPEAPYIAYGSQSAYTCLGIWLQDVRMLLHDYHLESHTLVKLFKQTTEVQRPPPIKGVEKNFFIFWDSEGKAYAHHDIEPNRVFAQLSFDGSVGPDLAPRSADNDNVCMAKYMPPMKPKDESIHQATNSLSITLCKRSDPACIPSDANTFIMTIFQHKTYYNWHGVYEPYVMLFQRSAPFAVHAISQRPLWIHGRGPLTKATGSLQYEHVAQEDMPKNHSEMFYMTSISWKSHGQKYHGYVDDVLFLAFGIEDSRPAAIDVLAGDLLQDLAFCAD